MGCCSSTSAPYQSDVNANKLGLRSTPLFIHLDKDELSKIASACTIKRFKQNTVVCHQGKVEKSFYVILSGQSSPVPTHARTPRRIAGPN